MQARSYLFSTSNCSWKGFWRQPHLRPWNGEVSYPTWNKRCLHVICWEIESGPPCHPPINLLPPPNPSSSPQALMPSCRPLPTRRISTDTWSLTGRRRSNGHTPHTQWTQIPATTPSLSPPPPSQSPIHWHSLGKTLFVENADRSVGAAAATAMKASLAAVLQLKKFVHDLTMSSNLGSASRQSTTNR